jgi:hypothetical protein
VAIDVKSTFGLDLPQSELDKAVKRLCFFAPTGSGTYVRELHEFLALQGLSLLPGGQHSAREIFQKVAEVLGARFEFEGILDALRRLSAKEVIQCSAERVEDTHARFSVYVDKRNELREQVKREERLEREVLREWKDDLLKKYTFLSAADID